MIQRHNGFNDSATKRIQRFSDATMQVSSIAKVQRFKGSQAHKPTGSQAHRLTGSQAQRPKSSKAQRLTGPKAHRLTGPKAHRLKTHRPPRIQIKNCQSILNHKLNEKYGISVNRKTGMVADAGRRQTSKRTDAGIGTTLFPG